MILFILIFLALVYYLLVQVLKVNVYTAFGAITALFLMILIFMYKTTVFAFQVIYDMISFVLTKLRL